MDELDNYITLRDSMGNDKLFEFLDYIIYEDDEYVVLLEDVPGADEVVILKIEEGETEDSESYVSVDDVTLQAVFEIFKERNKDIYNFGG
ncbi:MAG: DUF1292 domain-containing protein [Erysipelotrichaceae bacterium]|nr:DUF1292 domain-containing protein [Erysipelotrichaceae bacterium]